MVPFFAVILLAHAEVPPVAPSARDADWLMPFRSADLLYHPGPRPDFEALTPMEKCGRDAIPQPENNTCAALWWPGLGNGFVGGIAGGPTLRIAGFYSGWYARNYSLPPKPANGFSEKVFASRASIPAFGSSIVAHGTSLIAGSTRTALNTRDGVYYERLSIASGGKLEMRTYFHRTRRNLIVVEVELDCTACTMDAQVSLRSFSRAEVSDVVFHQRAVGASAAAGSGVLKQPAQLLGVLKQPENCQPSVDHLYDTNITLGFVHDVCPPTLAAAAGKKTRVRLLSALTLSSEDSEGDKDGVVASALKVYEDAKAIALDELLDEHRRGWAALWETGGIELTTHDFALQQTTNATFYYLLMSTRSDWLHSTLVPSSIAAAGPYPHGYGGHVFWDQDTFQAPPLMVLWPPIAKTLLQNRLFQLPAYRVNAKAFGLKGAWPPWEAGFSGGFAKDDLVNHEEVHVAGDVALFVKQYCQMTQTRSALRELFPLLEGISDFIVSRINRTDSKGWLSVENIVAPDESTGLVDVNNDIYTNAVSVLTLETTLSAAQTLGEKVSQKRLLEWQNAAARLKLQLAVFDGRLLHKEYDQYTFSSSINDTTCPKPSKKKFCSHPSIGQADSCLLGFPLQFNASARLWGGHKDEVRGMAIISCTNLPLTHRTLYLFTQVRLNDISYYGPRVSPQGSYMTAGHYVIAWLEKPHRNFVNASDWFAKGRAKNYPPFRLWAEHDQNDGGAVNFLTAGGMFLQSLIFGYGGLRFSDRGVSLDPLLPPGVTAMKLRGLNFADAEFDVEVQESGSRILRRNGSDDSGKVVVHRAPDGVYWLALE